MWASAPTASRGSSRVSLGEVALRTLPGTEGARYPFWSADSRQVAFFADGRLKGLAISGGEPRAICEAPFGQAGAWGEDGVILFPLSGHGGLHRVRMEGGVAARVTDAGRRAGDFAHRAPHFLPDGRRFVFLVRSTSPDREGIYVGNLDGAAPRQVLRSLSEAWYADGHLLFVQPPALMAVKVDPDTLEQDGAPVALSREASHESFSGRGLFSVSSTGTVVFSAMRTPVMRLMTLDRHGRRRDTDVVPGVFWDLARAPGGLALALTRQDAGASTRDIWKVDLKTNRSERLTTHAADDAMPVWSPDGRQLAFSSRRNGTYDIFVQSMTAGGAATPVVTGDGDQWVNDWSSDGRLLLYSLTTPGNSTRSDLFVFDIADGQSWQCRPHARPRYAGALFTRWPVDCLHMRRGRPARRLRDAVSRATAINASASRWAEAAFLAGGPTAGNSTTSMAPATWWPCRSISAPTSTCAARRWSRAGSSRDWARRSPAWAPTTRPRQTEPDFLVKEPTEAVAGPITVVVNGIGRRVP